MDVIKLAKENEELCIEMRRDLHMIPELELELPKTVKYIKDRLDSWGVEYQEFVNGNAIVALIEGNGAGECIGIRADMDALPITEETGVEYASTHPGCMHACGHDGHAAIALTTLKILNENKDDFKGSVKFFFQPGEEIPGGAKPMIDEGALENPRPDFMLGLHSGNVSKMEVGKIGFREGAMMASMDRFSIKVNGRGGHGANPHEAIDPIIISGEILMGLQKIISRELAPYDQALVSVCKIEGGTSQNIIPDEVNMLGTARTLNEKARDLIEDRILGISDGIAKTYGGSAELFYERMYPVLKNEPEFTKYVKGLAAKLFPDDVEDLENPTMGGEDMAFFLQEVPGTFFFLSNVEPHSDGVRYPHHNSKFNLDESQFYKGISIFLGTVFDKLGN